MPQLTNRFEWPHGNPVLADHITIPVVDGFDIVLTSEVDAEDIAMAYELAAKVRARREVQS